MSAPKTRESTPSKSATPGRVATFRVMAHTRKTAPRRQVERPLAPPPPLRAAGDGSVVAIGEHTATDQSSSLAFIDYNWNRGFIDGPTPLPSGQGSFDRIAGSILTLLDFDDRPNLRRLILDRGSGQIFGDDDGGHDHDRK